jgi:uncharacterized protein (TIGR00369 family)
MTALPIDNPFLEWLGVELTAWSEGYAEMRLAMTPNLSNRSARAHGGVLCTLLDSVAGYSGLYSPPGETRYKGLTLSLTTNFLHGAEGDFLIAKGHLERRGRSIYFSRAEVWQDDVQLLATAMGSFKYYRL